MKSDLSSRFVFMIVAMVILAVSCSKDDNTGNPNPQPSPGSASDVLGNITDLGLVSDNTRLMRVEFSSQGDLYDSNTGTLIGRNSRIFMDIYTDADGHLSDGSYYKAASPAAPVPFTFDNAMVITQSPDPNNGEVIHEISYGVVSVERFSDRYNFTFDYRFPFGKSIDGTFNGKMIYADEDSK